jgi:hypothetical protein
MVVVGLIWDGSLAGPFLIVVFVAWLGGLVLVGRRANLERTMREPPQ